MKTAEMVSVGTEILLGQIVDTNAQHLGAIFPELGIRHVYRQTVGDNLERLTEALKLALSRADIVVTIGGLGPTRDDLTRDGIAAALGDTLILDHELVESLHRQFTLRKLTWLPAQERQAMRPSCGRAIPNPNGTAPGLICVKGGKVVIAMPGPRGEFVAMADGAVREYLTGLSGEEVIHSKTLRICGLGESMVEDRVKKWMEGENPTVAPYAKVGEVHLRITARANSVEEAEMLMAPAEAGIRQVLGAAVYGIDEETLEGSIIFLLKQRRQTVAAAESITGGLLGARLTSVAGASEVFLGGVISYTDEVKRKLLGVDETLLNDPEIGPVSEEVALEMAAGVRARLGADFAVGLTGNAGPAVQAGGKPVGRTFVAVAGPSGVEVHDFSFRGTREDIQRRAAQMALTALRDLILQTPIG